MKNSQQRWLKRLIKFGTKAETQISALFGVLDADVSVRAYSLQDLFVPAG